MLVRQPDVRDDLHYLLGLGSERVAAENLTSFYIVDLRLIYLPPSLEFYYSGEFRVIYEYEVCIADRRFV